MGEQLNEGITQYANCYGCGADNPHGLGLTFESHDGRLSAQFIPETHHEGWPGVVHGGIINALLYEIMENWPFARGIVTMARSMETRFRRPASIGRSITASSWLARRDGREMAIEANLECEGIVVAEGRATLVVLSGDQRERLGI